MQHNLPLRPPPRDDSTPATTSATLSLDSDDSTVDRLNPTATTRRPREQNNRQQHVDHEGNNRKSSSETAAAATTTTAAVETAQVTTTTAAAAPTTTSSTSSSPPSSSGTTITLPPVPKPLNVLCLVLSIAGYLLETTMNVSIAIFGIGVGVGLIIGDTATAVTNSSSSSGSGSNIHQTNNMMMTAYPQQQHPGINNNGRDIDINPYHHYANSRTNLLPAQ